MCASFCYSAELSGADSVETARLENKLGVIMFRIGRPDEGTRLYQHALAVLSRPDRARTAAGASRPSSRARGQPSPASRPSSAGRPSSSAAQARQSSAAGKAQPRAVAERQLTAAAPRTQSYATTPTRPARRGGPSQVGSQPTEPTTLGNGPGL